MVQVDGRRGGAVPGWEGVDLRGRAGCLESVGHADQALSVIDPQTFAVNATVKLPGPP